MKNLYFRQFTHIIFVSQLIVAIMLIEPHNFVNSKPKNYLPKELSNLKFGDSKSEVLSDRSSAILNKTEPFRSIYSEEINRSGISSVVYYFSTKGDEALYEITVIFDSESIMELKANALLGEFNYNGKENNSREWKFKIKKSHSPLHAWAYQNKIVYAMPLPNTEWNKAGIIGL